MELPRLVTDEPSRNSMNKKAASTVIILCAVAIAAVLMVHNESSTVAEPAVVPSDSASSSQSTKMSTVSDAQDSFDYMDQDSEDMMFLQNEKDDILLSKPKAKAPKAKPSIHALDAPTHSSVHNGGSSPYGASDFAPQAVKAATQTATKSLDAGQPVQSAFVSAQQTATKVVRTSETAHLRRSSVFSAKIEAAAYAAKKRALKALETGQSPEEAKLAATEAAKGVVNAEGNSGDIDLYDQYPDSLPKLLAHVDIVWQKMKGKLVSMSAMLKRMPKDCSKATAFLQNSHGQMRRAMQQAAHHLNKGQKHHAATETLLLQEASVSDYKQQHEAAQEHASQAMGFLAVAAKEHKEVSNAALRCKVEQALAKFKALPKFKRAETVSGSSSPKGMRVTLQIMMYEAAKTAAVASLKGYTGPEPGATAKKAASEACAEVLKAVSKTLATRLAREHKGVKKVTAMKKAIVTVLNAGRPLETGVVNGAVKKALEQVDQQLQAGFPSHAAPKERKWPSTGMPPVPLFPSSKPETGPETGLLEENKGQVSPQVVKTAQAQQKIHKVVNSKLAKEYTAKAHQQQSKLKAIVTAKKQVERTHKTKSKQQAEVALSGAIQKAKNLQRQNKQQKAPKIVVPKAAPPQHITPVSRVRQETLAHFVSRATSAAAHNAQMAVKTQGGDVVAQIKAASAAAAAASKLAVANWRAHTHGVSAKPAGLVAVPAAIKHKKSVKAASMPKQQDALAQKLEAVARSAVSKMKGKATAAKVKATAQAAAIPVLAEAINRAASLAAAAAAKRAKVSGWEPGLTKQVVAKAAESAALKTKQAGVHFLQVVVERMSSGAVH